MVMITMIANPFQQKSREYGDVKPYKNNVVANGCQKIFQENHSIYVLKSLNFMHVYTCI